MQKDQIAWDHDDKRQRIMNNYRWSFGGRGTKNFQFIFKYFSHLTHVAHPEHEDDKLKSKLLQFFFQLNFLQPHRHLRFICLGVDWAKRIFSASLNILFSLEFDFFCCCSSIDDLMMDFVFVFRYRSWIFFFVLLRVFFPFIRYLKTTWEGEQLEW